MILDLLPASFWFAAASICVGLVISATQIRRGIGIPMIIVLITIVFWYVGDVFYNDYVHIHMELFERSILEEAWVQVGVFIIIFVFLAPIANRIMNHRAIAGGSQIIRLTPAIVASDSFQSTLDKLLRIVAFTWIVVIIAASLRYQKDILYYFFPFVGIHPGPWAVNGLGSGFDAFWSLMNYLQLMVGSLFGVIAALSQRPRTRRLALAGVLLTWPFYIFDRTRKFILLIAVPGIASWAFFRLSGRIAKKLTILILAGLIVNGWFGFIISTRQQGSVSAAFESNKFSFSKASVAEHQGLNMYEELSWIIRLRGSGVFNPEPGANYFANLVNPVPRFLWPDKPTIGLDYARARGLGGGEGAAGVYATLSDGLIGQGVVNFGLFAGPAFAALLMAFWAGWLSRIDLHLKRTGYLPLYALGLIITFTMGRDITLLEAYPFVFGYLICGHLHRTTRPNRKRAPLVPDPRRVEPRRPISPLKPPE